MPSPAAQILPTVMLVLPPLTQLNTPYPSTAYLARFLGAHGVSTRQRDLGIELVLNLFSRAGLDRIFAELETRDELPEAAWRALALKQEHLRAVEPALSFLQGLDSGLAPRILDTAFLPMGPALARADVADFGSMGTHDAARHLATLYLRDLVDLVTSTVDPGFGLAQYQHHLAIGAESFEPLYARLGETTLVDEAIDGLADTLEGDIIGLSVPFPGNLYSALRIGRRLKQRGATVVMGGGYVNTELRDVDETRLWEFVDALTYDDGEGPLLALVQHHAGGPDHRHRTRTVEGLHSAKVDRPAYTAAGDYGDLDLSLYLQLIDTLNPAHRLWADGRWNKITLAHGCYWRKCSFCDVRLDYIQHYETPSVPALVDEMERLIAQTGQRGFHFVDEAAPPKVLEKLALELLKRNLGVTLWGNIRFEKTFTPDLCRLLSAAGLVAVTGGLEVASDRLLKQIRKGVTVEQVARCAQAFRSAGVMVHAYLMYGFPTQTEQETIDSMELVRQLFETDLVNSAFWHRFVLTRHAPIHDAPETFGVQLPPTGSRFANNDLPHVDPTGCDHDRFDAGLVASLRAWMQGRELGRPVHTWFDRAPFTLEPPDRIASALAEERSEGKRLVWLGGTPIVDEQGVQLHHADGELFVPCSTDERDWLEATIDASRPDQPPLAFEAARQAFPGHWADFAARWARVRGVGAVLI